MISVVIPTVRSTTIQFAVESVRRQEFEDWELLIIGQGSDPSLIQAGESLAADGDRVRYIHLERRGVSLARNAGLTSAGGDVVAYLDDDCEADPQWLSVIDRRFSEDPDLGLLGGSIVAPADRGGLLEVCQELIVEDAVYDPAAGKQAPQGFDFAAANFAFRRKTALEIGPFDELLGVGGEFRSAEDLDYKFRFERAGVRMRSTPAMLVHHTYGCYSGLRAVFRHQQGYAIGQGAIAAKWTLSGDARGKDWLDDAKPRWLGGRHRSSLKRTPNAVLRWYYMRQGYRRCCDECTVDAESSLLVFR